MNYLNIRTSRARNNTIEEFSFFVNNIKQTNSTHTRFTGRGMYTVFNTIKVLDCLTDGDKTFSDLYAASGFGYKGSFLNYLNMCRHFDLLTKEAVGKIHVYYHITEKGKIFLDLFKTK